DRRTHRPRRGRLHPVRAYRRVGLLHEPDARRAGLERLPPRHAARPRPQGRAGPARRREPRHRPPPLRRRGPDPCRLGPVQRLDRLPRLAACRSPARLHPRLSPGLVAGPVDHLDGGLHGDGAPAPRRPFL
ncbi:MAG: hypothetical protein AVDCRST_MAG15-2455, partial [uncultured Rubellimicrobium sp.]